MGSLEELQGLVNIRSQFQDAVVSFIILRQIDWSEMLCPHCKGEGGVVLDGTKVAFQSLHSRLQNTWRTYNQAQGAAVPQTPCEQLVFTRGLPEKVKKRLLRFTLHRKRFDRKKGKFFINPDAGLLKSEYDELGTWLGSDAGAHAAILRALTHSMVPRVQTVTVTVRRRPVQQDLYFPNEAVRWMLQALVSCYPVQAVLPPAAVEDVRAYLDGVKGGVDLVGELQKIKQRAPLVSDFLDSMAQLSAAENRTDYTVFMATLLDRLCTMSLEPFSGIYTRFGCFDVSLSLSVCVCVLPIYHCIWLSIYPSIYLSIYLSIYISSE